MNKGIIMELKKNYAIALSDEGVMEKIVSKKNMEVGQKIFYFDDDIIRVSTNNVYRHNNFIKAFGSIAALFLIVFTFFHTMKSEEAYAVVSLDINPSIQIEADSNLKIIKVEGINDDGKNIDFKEIKDMYIDDGIQIIKEKLEEKNYLDTNKDILVCLAFEQNGDNITYEQNVQDAIKTTFKSDDVTVTYVKGDKESIDEAKTQGISLGRYEASLKVDEETKKNIDVVQVREIVANMKDKDNVIQWEVTDQKEIDLPAANVNPNVNIEQPKSDTPIINAPVDNQGSNNNESKGQDNINKPQTGNDVIILEPEAPAQSEPDKGTVTTPPKNEGEVINIEPSNGGTIENNTTSGKIEETPGEMPAGESSKPQENLENKDNAKQNNITN